jgi:tRNA U34 5-methylaminomethyl-2-thiouridine-forming methyltransferase MnmC
MEGEKNNENLEVITTRDGSKTILNKALNATYHSKFGALQESQHIFIQNGLLYAKDVFGEELNVLEIGFGTGLNALLTLRETVKSNLRVNYYTFEKFPIPPTLYKDLGYAEEKENEEVLFSKLHESEWDKEIQLTNHFKITKYRSDAIQSVFPGNIHVIYFDVFAPSIDPGMWSPSIFIKLHQNLSPRGCLVTFCAKGEVKRMLKEIGFSVETLAGPPGKREMVRAGRK